MKRQLVGATRLPSRSLAPRFVATAALALLLAACGSSTGSPTPVANASPAASASPAPSIGAATPSTDATTGVDASSGSAGASASPVVTVTIDRSLARLLPAAVGGVSVVPATATEEAAKTSVRFADSASGFEAVEVIKAPDADLAIASIIRLRPGGSPATFYADWRPPYDDAACRPAGGVSTRETEQIGGRTVDVTHCVQGATLYHVWLGGEQVLVSVLDVGTSGLGRALVEGATDPAP
jgi:hypothetical protein